MDNFNINDIKIAIDEYNQSASDSVPDVLKTYLQRVSRTGETLFPWVKVKKLVVSTVQKAMRDSESHNSMDDLPHCPNKEITKFEVQQNRILKALDNFDGAPFTVQRLVEIAMEPRKYYKRTDKLLHAIEKNVLVVSTVDPYGNRIICEDKSVNGINGLDTTEDNSSVLFPPPPANTPVVTGMSAHEYDATFTAPIRAMWLRDELIEDEDYQLQINNRGDTQTPIPSTPTESISPTQHTASKDPEVKALAADLSSGDGGSAQETAATEPVQNTMNEELATVTEQRKKEESAEPMATHGLTEIEPLKQTEEDRSTQSRCSDSEGSVKREASDILDAEPPLKRPRNADIFATEHISTKEELECEEPSNLSMLDNEDSHCSFQNLEQTSSQEFQEEHESDIQKEMQEDMKQETVTPETNTEKTTELDSISENSKDSTSEDSKTSTSEDSKDSYSEDFKNSISELTKDSNSECETAKLHEEMDVSEYGTSEHLIGAEKEVAAEKEAGQGDSVVSLESPVKMDLSQDV